MRNDSCEYLFSEWGCTHADDCAACLPASPRIRSDRTRNFLFDLAVGVFLLFALASGCYLVLR